MHTKVRELIDAFRTAFVGGRVMMTAGNASLPRNVRAEILERVQAFNTFTKDNDPHCEHDFGAFEVADLKVNWKLDCYDAAVLEPDRKRVE